MVMAEQPSAKTNHYKAKPGEAWEWRGGGRDRGCGLTTNQESWCFEYVVSGQRWARRTESQSYSSGVNNPGKGDSEWDRGLLRGCFPRSKTFCLSEGRGKKSPAEKCHLQPDMEARAFTNLPVTMTA